MKNMICFLFVVIVWLNSMSVKAADFLDVQSNSVYNNTINTEKNDNILSIAQASEDSLNYREYDSNLRIIKKTVWKNDFSGLKEITTWEYDDGSVFPTKKLITNLEDELDTEISYEYDAKDRVKTKIQKVSKIITPTETTKVTDTTAKTDVSDSKDVIETKIDYSYHNHKDNLDKDVLLRDELIYINDVLSEKLVWLTATQKELTKYYNNKISISTMYEKGLKKSEIIVKDGIKIGEKTWE